MEKVPASIEVHKVSGHGDQAYILESSTEAAIQINESADVIKEVREVRPKTPSMVGRA